MKRKTNLLCWLIEALPMCHQPRHPSAGFRHSIIHAFDYYSVRVINLEPLNQDNFQFFILLLHNQYYFYSFVFVCTILPESLPIESFLNDSLLYEFPAFKFASNCSNE